MVASIRAADLTRPPDCGNTIANGGAPASDGCNMLCNGNSTEYCGGPNRLNLYNFEGQFEPPSTTTTTPAPTDPDATEIGGDTTSSLTAVPTGPSHPETVGAFTWYGCQTEATGIRALSSLATASDAMTLETCETFCAGYTYFGTEYSRECKIIHAMAWSSFY